MVTKKGIRKKEKPRRVRVSRKELKFKNPFMSHGEQPNKRLNRTYKAPIFNPNMTLGEESLSNEKLRELEQMQRKGMLSKDFDLTNLRSKLSSNVLPGGVQNVSARDRGSTIMREAERVTTGILSSKAAEEKKVMEAAQKRKEEKSKRKAIAYLAETDELDQIPGELREEVNKWYHMGLPRYLFNDDERLHDIDTIIARLLCDARYRKSRDIIRWSDNARDRRQQELFLDYLERTSPDVVTGKMNNVYVPSHHLTWLNREGLYLYNLLKQSKVRQELDRRGEIKRRLDNKRRLKSSEGRPSEIARLPGESVEQYNKRVTRILKDRLDTMSEDGRSMEIEDLFQTVTGNKKENMPTPIAQGWTPEDTRQVVVGSGGWKAPRLGKMLRTYETRETLEPFELPKEREEKESQQLQGRRQMLREYYKEKRGKEPPRGMIERGMPKFVSPYEEREERDEGDVIVLHPFVFGRKRKFHFDI